MAGRDITEGRSSRAIAVDVGVVASTSLWQNTDVAYDVAIGGMPFIYAITDKNTYVRQTAPYRKEQFDNQTEPGEQSLTGWWIRSQSSFHNGMGITFFDPSAGEAAINYRFTDSKNVNVWEKGQATLLRKVNVGHMTTQPTNGFDRSYQQLRSIQWNGTNGVLLHDGYDLDKIDAAGNETHFVDYNAGIDDKVYAACDDGTYVFWVTNDTGPTGKLEVNKKPLTGNASTAATVMFTAAGITVANAAMEYVKDRIVMCVNNAIYEFPVNATALPTAVYTHGDNDHIFTSITASGSAIYVAGFSGVQSNIYKFTLATNGSMPTLTSAITAAELPTGEVVHKIYYYLGYMLIGTSKGVRVALVSDQDGSINYGPLLFESSQPVYGFAARDHYVWCASSVDGDPGVIRIDLSAEVDTLRFAYANDIYFNASTNNFTTDVAFAGTTDQLIFCTEAGSQTAVTNKARTGTTATLTAAGHGLVTGDVIYVIGGVDTTIDGGPYTVTSTTTNTVSFTTASSVTIASTAAVGFVGKAGFTYVEDDSELAESGYLRTGFIRYGTLEPKNFKRLLGRGIFDYGSMSMTNVLEDNTEYDIITYDATVTPVEVGITTPGVPQEYMSFKFTLNRDGTDNTKGPVFKGYQVKSTIATPRQRAIRFPVYMFDVEVDKFNVEVGYEGRAMERLQELEAIEQNGDVVTWQDLTTNESRQCVIEQINFVRQTPPDRGFSGFGGVVEITIRTV